jgi:hypothetical protein
MLQRGETFGVHGMVLSRLRIVRHLHLIAIVTSLSTAAFVGLLQAGSRAHALGGQGPENRDSNYRDSIWRR